MNRSFPVAEKMTRRRKINVKSEKMEPVQICGVLKLFFDSGTQTLLWSNLTGVAVWKSSNTAAHNDEITSRTQQKHHPKTEHSQDHHRRLHFPPSHYLFFLFRSHSQLQTEQTATRGSTSVFSLLGYIRFLSLSTFTALLCRLSAKCSNTCKPYKINSRYSRNRNDGCYACLFPQSCKCISHHHKFRVNQNIEMFFLGWRKKEVGFTASRRSGLNCTRNLSSSACGLSQPPHQLSSLSGRVSSSVPAEADAAAALLTCRTCCGWESL